MSERRLEAGSFAVDEFSDKHLLLTTEDARWVTYNWDCDGVENWLAPAELTPCAPPPDSPLGRAEAEIERLRGALRSIRVCAGIADETLARIDAALQEPRV